MHFLFFCSFDNRGNQEKMKESDWYEKLNDAINVSNLHTQYINLYTRFGIHDLVSKELPLSPIDKHGRGSTLMKSTSTCVYQLDENNSVFKNKLNQLKSLKNTQEHPKEEANVSNLLDSFRLRSS